MTPEDFAECIHDEVIEDNLKCYHDLLAKPSARIDDPVWQKISRAYETMSETQRNALHLMARQAMIDTASNILGILDGTSILRDHREEFSVIYGSAGDRLNGDLQDHFLARVEDGSRNED